MSIKEIENLVFELSQFERCRLQQVRLSGEMLALGFYTNELTWLYFDLNPKSPQVLLFDTFENLKIIDDKKPLVLFLRAHFVGQKLDQTIVRSDAGRVVFLQFENKNEIEIRLFPHGQNVFAKVFKSAENKSDKSISLYKPRDVHLMDRHLEIKSHFSASIRNISQRSREWREEKFLNPKNENKLKAGLQGVGGPSAEELRDKKAEKIKKIIQKLELEIETKENSKWRETGEWIKENQSLNVPEIFKEYILGQAPLAKNIERCFLKAKEDKIKLQGTILRKNQLQVELKNILGPAVEKYYGLKLGVSHRPQLQTNLLHDANSKGRTFNLSDEIILFVGKSAKDNLRLLREAKPWHLWLHLQDIPSCHGIIHCFKNKPINDALLRKAIFHLITCHFGSKASGQYGEKFAAMVAECRHVQPIKGDKIGRVTCKQSRIVKMLFDKK